MAKVLVGSVPELTQADAYAIMQKAHKRGCVYHTVGPLGRRQ